MTKPALALVDETPSLSPARSALAAHLRQIEDARAAAERARQPERRLQIALDAERDAEAAAAAVADREAADAASWAVSGIGAAPGARHEERELAQRRLADARAAADAARAALPKIESARVAADRHVAEVFEAARALVRQVVDDEAAKIAERMAAAFAIVCRGARALRALDQLTGAGISGGRPSLAGRFFGRGSLHHGDLVAVAGFDLAGLRVEDLPDDLRSGLRPADFVAAQRAWSAFGDALMADASAPVPSFTD